MPEYQLPSDGSVLIIDDRINEALPLIELLSKKGIASTFYTGTEDIKLPVKPVQKVRLAFIDIQLFPAGNSNTYAQNILRLLDRIIPDDNGPYILIVWSVREDLHAGELKTRVMSSAYKRRPVIFLPLQKAAYFDPVQEIDESLRERLDEAYRRLSIRFGEDGLASIKNEIDQAIERGPIYKAKDDALQLISGELQKKLAEAEAFHLFTIWENLVNKASGKTVASFSKLYQQDEYWKDNLKSGIYRMAHAQLGPKIVKVDDNNLIVNALKTLNQTFLDVLGNDICQARGLSDVVAVRKDYIYFTKKIDDHEYKIKWPVDKDKCQLFVDGQLTPPSSKGHNVNQLEGLGRNATEKSHISKVVHEYLSIKPEINTRLLVERNTPQSVEPGNVYLVEVADMSRRKQLLKHYFYNPDSKKQIIGDTVVDKDGNYLVSDEELMRILFIELEVTPLCDYVQEKQVKIRILPGILIPELYCRKIDSPPDSFYTQIPPLMIREKCYKPVFDFRLLKSVDIGSYPDASRSPLFRVRNEVTADILSRLASHASRVGLTYVE